MIEFRLCDRWFDFQWCKTQYTLLMRPNKVETAVEWFSMSHEVLAGFFGHGNSIYIYIYIYIQFTALVFTILIKFDFLNGEILT